MICPSCFGTGYRFRRSYPGNELFPYPCESCGVRGVIHCCEGDRADEPPPPAHPAFREHDPSADCWCDPAEIDDGVYLHRHVT